MRLRINPFWLALIIMIVFFVPLDTIRRGRRSLAGLVMYQWRRLSLVSSVVYALLVKNGHDPDEVLEDLERYLYED